MKAERYDFIMKNVRFESVLELYNAYKEMYSSGTQPTIYYDGSNYDGDVAIACAKYAEASERDKAIKIAVEKLKYYI